MLGLERAEWWFWLKWVLVNAVTVAGAGAALWPALWAQATTWVAFGALAVACVVAGTAQWLVLRRRVQLGGWWVFASAVGSAVALVAGSAVGLAVARAEGAGMAAGGAVGSVVAGAVLGTAQWLILRKRVQRSGWWVLASGLGWAVGWMVGGVVGPVAGAVGATWVGLVGGAVVGAVYGALTGIALVLLLRRPIQPGRPAVDA